MPENLVQAQPGRVPRRAARGRAGGSHRDPEDAAAEVFLRRARQRTVRRDHPAARVLPDPGRDGDPRARAGQIAGLTRCESLVELGSGTSAKTRLLLRALRDGGTLREFVPFDVDPAVLTAATEALAEEYPGLRVEPFVGDFERHLGALPRTAGAE